MVDTKAYSQTIALNNQTNFIYVYNEYHKGNAPNDGNLFSLLGNDVKNHL